MGQKGDAFRGFRKGDLEGRFGVSCRVGFDNWIQGCQDAHFKTNIQVDETWKHETNWKFKNYIHTLETINVILKLKYCSI